jgi:mRNA-degrading endonuclease RelE of RelBE toxin-antitoxin system
MSKNMEKGKYPPINYEYQGELDRIKEEVKKGNCHQLKECLFLIQEIWNKEYSKNVLISHTAHHKLEKLSRKNQGQYQHVEKKIGQILRNPGHYKPLRGDLSGERRVHVGDFVLIFHEDPDGIVIDDYDHHDRIYG